MVQANTLWATLQPAGLQRVADTEGHGRPRRGCQRALMFVLWEFVLVFPAEETEAGMRVSPGMLFIY